MKLSAKAPTDYWRKPPSLDVDSAPKSLQTIPAKSFTRARVTVSASWTRLYDQGGLFILFPQSAEGKQFWLKTGIEFYNNQPNLSTVAAREWADWSLLPLSSNSITVEIERENKDGMGKGPSLWIYLVEGNKRTAVREVTWAFEKDDDDIQVGVYAARPTVEGDAEDALEVSFEDFVLE
ncbi:hypothetical protein BD410DRAFT_784174 [Rickenella mellea]|uniref:DUF1349-domain-containing protein n=1 Tax=Rickenella mellea TaxID=50990 RepID=A0A4Y7QEM8_9AGAM|nr:hypothetical protein BD410DRAFT_784174 [Rickenella mellea]